MQLMKPANKTSIPRQVDLVGLPQIAHVHGTKDFGLIDLEPRSLHVPQATGR